MGRPFHLFMKTGLLLAICVFFSACNEAIPRRSTISPQQLTDKDEECPEGFYEESRIEKDEETSEEYEIVECVENPKTRPNGAIMFKTDFCGCLDGKAMTYGNCSSFCANRGNTNKTEIFFANFNVTADIALSGLGSVHGWCTAALPGDPSNPKCQIEAKGEDGSTTMLDVTPIAGSNSITANITDLQMNKTWVVTLVETVSKARSNSVQVIKFSPDIGIPIIGPLKNAPISQYSCMVREGGNTDMDIFYDYSYRMHFYFLPRRPPNPIPPNTPNIICHDIFNPLYGINDDVLFPRLEAQPGALNLWDTSDPRFYDNNGNTHMDVNDIIVQKTKNFGGTVPANVNLFSPFRWPNEPELGDPETTAKNNMPLGYYMLPWIDPSSFKSYCLNSTHYNSENALFKALRDVIGVDTEGLYVGEKSVEVIPGNNGDLASVGYKDVILIRESDLKQVWFYLNNGVPTAPTDENVANVAVFFYYPLNKLSPFVKTSTQRLYRVKGGEELNANGDNSGNSSSSGAANNYPPHDRKIGCVPKF